MPTMNNEVGASDAACINETLRGEEEERAVNVAGRALLAGSLLPPSWSRRPSQNEHATSPRPLQRSFGRPTGICFGGAVFIIIFIVDLTLIGAITAATGPTAKTREGKDQLRRAKILRTSTSSTAQSIVKAAPLSASRNGVGKDLKKVDGIGPGSDSIHPELGKNDKFTIARHGQQNQLSRRAQDTTTAAPTTAPTYTNHPTAKPTAKPTSSFHRMEKKALEAFYNSTGGDNWHSNYRWLEEEDHCSWDGVYCNNDGRVNGLYLEENNLVGTIPTEIGRLTKLTLLHLYMNKLTGPILTEIGWLTQLEDLNIKNNELTGPIPTEIVNLTKLTWLDLAENELTGPIPTEIGKLTELYQISLGGNELTGPIPTEIGRLTKLERLSLYGDELTGPIPTEIGKLAKLKSLYLGWNELTGSIPTEIGRLTQLTRLSLDGNELTGPIPTEIGELTKLGRLSLGWNELTGPIPREIGKLTKLTWLYLYGNELTGPIPKEIGRLTQLTLLSLGGNELTGPIPTKIGELTKLTSLSLERNELTSPIPTEIGKLTKLTWLSLDGNELTGPVPKEIGKLEKLTELYLAENKLTSPIPKEIGNLTKLTWLDLYGNELTSPIPTEIGKLTKLTLLRLDGNELTGPIPKEIGNLTQLWQLNLGDASLTGSIPKEIGNLTQLEQLFLEGNSLTGTLPMELGYLSKLTKLALQNNNLNGTVPEALGIIAGLRNLDFSRNEIQSFPFKGEWPYLVSLDLRHNQIKQTIPTELNGLARIKQLLLSNNSIFGSIPDQLGSLLRMEELHLDSNRLHGTIPDGLLFLSRLRELKLSHNSGSRCFDGSSCDYDSVSTQTTCCDETGTFCSKEVEWDDKRSMYCVTGIVGLWGTIPAGFGNVPYLKMLDLSHNSLTGSIPPELGDLPRLETLDITHNNLSGSIPSDLGALVETSISLSGNDFSFLDDNGTRITKAPLSLCAVPDFDLTSSEDWCPPERNALKNFYESAKGQEWTEASGWVKEYNDHCEWDGVHCDNMTGKVVELLLKNNGLSGRIDSSIGDLTSLETLDLNDNDLQGSIPTALGRLMNLSRVRFSFNALTGEIPDDLGNISELTLLHLHGNRLTGTIPGFKFQSLDSHSTFITDCGSPSDYDAPLECSDCTMCCNSIGECERASKKGLSYGELAAVVMGSIIALFCIVALLALLSKQCRRMLSLILFQPTEWNKTSHGSNPLPQEYAWKAIGENSVYSFVLTTSWVGWFFSIATLSMQTFAFVVFIEAAELVFSDDSKDWVYSWRCPRNSDACDDKKDDLTQGWVFFAILMAVHLAPDLINGTKLLGMFAWQNRLSWKSSQCFFGGLCLFLISALALYASVIYNLAIARSNTELITNAVIILFINDIDEQLYCLLGVVSPVWLDGLTSQAKKYPEKSMRQDMETLRPRISSEDGGDNSGDGISLEMQELKRESEKQKQQMERLQMESEQFKSALAILQNKINELPVEQKSVISIAPICVGTVGQGPRVD